MFNVFFYSVLTYIKTHWDIISNIVSFLGAGNTWNKVYNLALNQNDSSLRVFSKARETPLKFLDCEYYFWIKETVDTSILIFIYKSKEIFTCQGKVCG
jgi:hypothetical protein